MGEGPFVWLLLLAVEDGVDEGKEFDEVEGDGASSAARVDDRVALLGVTGVMASELVRAVVFMAKIASIGSS